MAGVFVRVEREELREVLGDMLISRESSVNLAQSTSELKKLRVSKFKYHREIELNLEQLDLEVTRLKSYLPEVELPGTVGTLKVRSDRASSGAMSKARRTKYQAELEEIKKRLSTLRKG